MAQVHKTVIARRVKGVSVPSARKLASADKAALVDMRTGAQPPRPSTGQLAYEGDGLVTTSLAEPRLATWLARWSAPALVSSAPRRLSAFQAGHIPSWHRSCGRYALSLVAAGSWWLLPLLSPLLSTAVRRTVGPG